MTDELLWNYVPSFLLNTKEMRGVEDGSEDQIRDQHRQRIRALASVQVARAAILLLQLVQAAAFGNIVKAVDCSRHFSLEILQPDDTHDSGHRQAVESLDRALLRHKPPLISPDST